MSSILMVFGALAFAVVEDSGTEPTDSGGTGTTQPTGETGFAETGTTIPPTTPPTGTGTGTCTGTATGTGTGTRTGTGTGTGTGSGTEPYDTGDTGGASASEDCACEDATGSGAAVAVGLGLIALMRRRRS